MPKIKRRIINSFTTVNNEYLRDQTLGLVERGLLTTMLSLPDNWEFSGRGLAAILPDGREKIFKTLRHLEEHGYLQRNKITVKGKIVDYEYEFCDSPVFPKKEEKANEHKTEKKPCPKNWDAAETEPCPRKPDTGNQDNNKY